MSWIADRRHYATYASSFLSYLQGKFVPGKKKTAYDLVLIIPKESQGWILDGICKEIVKYYPGKWFMASDINNLPVATNYFFAHYSFYVDCLKVNPSLWGSNTILLYTHLKFSGSNHEFRFVLNSASKVICMNSWSVDDLAARGVRRSKLDYVISGADPDIFYTHTRGNGVVGFCTAYYDRKNPDRILELVSKLTHRKFLLLGRNWNEYPRYQELANKSNLEIKEIQYEEYPAEYARMDVFVSVSKLEGGPIPLLESMMSNVVPVTSDTGFARDVITHGTNGYIFDTEANVDEIASLVETAFDAKVNVRDTVLHFTWENFSKNVQKFFKK